MRQTLAVSLLEQPSASDRLRGVNLSVNTKKPAQESREKGKFVYKSSNTTGLRIGKGGPEIKMDTMTGDLLIEKFKSSNRRIQ